MANTIGWVDIPVLDLTRAIGFYSAVLGTAIQKQSFPNGELGLLPHADTGVSGCLFQTKDVRPSDQGPLVYFNCSNRLDEAVAAVVPHGGKVLQPRHPIGPHGHRAVVLDSEGNRIALHTH